MTNLHTPVRPTWNCAACGREWPCSGAHGRLLAEFDGAPTSLNIYLAGMYMAASQDLRFHAAGELYQRFLGWVGRRH
jgi:hypothetical protein